MKTKYLDTVSSLRLGVLEKVCVGKRDFALLYFLLSCTSIEETMAFPKTTSRVLSQICWHSERVYDARKGKIERPT